MARLRILSLSVHRTYHESGSRLVPGPNAGARMLANLFQYTKRFLLLAGKATICGVVLALGAACYAPLQMPASALQAGIGGLFIEKALAVDVEAAELGSHLEHGQHTAHTEYVVAVDSAGTSLPSPHTDKLSDADALLMAHVSEFHRMGTRKPINLAHISSTFGERSDPFKRVLAFHNGIDFAAPRGSPVLACADGTVVKAMKHKEYGNMIVINHHNGYMTLYAHNEKLLVKVGDKVKAGQPIAKVGSTGRSTGPHLHFEIHRGGKRVDPAPYLAML